MKSANQPDPRANKVASLIIPPFARLMSRIVTPYRIAIPARLSIAVTLCVLRRRVRERNQDFVGFFKTVHVC